MSHPLVDAHLKIVWADEHLQKLKGEIARYIKTKPHELGRKKDVHGKWTTGPNITAQPDETLSLMVGDCLTNARASLDYVMFQLVKRYFDPPFDITNRDHRMVTAFPLFEKRSTDPTSAEMNRFSKLASFMTKVPADLFDTIKRVQPYNSGYEPLWWLHELVNTDKHRLLLVTRSDIPVAQFWFTYRDTTIGIGPTPFVANKDVFLAGGFSTNVGVSDFPEEVDVQYQPTIHVTFENLPVPLAGIKTIPVESVLQQILETVVQVLPQFDRFF